MTRRGSGSPEGAALWQGSGGVPQPIRGVPPPPLRLLQTGAGCPPAHKGRPPPPLRLLQTGAGCPPAHKGRPPPPLRLLKPALGVPQPIRGVRHPRYVSSNRRWVSPSPQGASRGDRPLWQEVWRVSLQSFITLPATFLQPALGVPQPTRDASPPATSSLNRRRPKGASRGDGRRFLHKLGRKGVRGMVLY